MARNEFESSRIFAIRCAVAIPAWLAAIAAGVYFGVTAGLGGL